MIIITLWSLIRATPPWFCLHQVGRYLTSFQFTHSLRGGLDSHLRGEYLYQLRYVLWSSLLKCFPQYLHCPLSRILNNGRVEIWEKVSDYKLLLKHSGWEPPDHSKGCWYKWKTRQCQKKRCRWRQILLTKSCLGGWTSAVSSEDSTTRYTSIAK